MYDTVFQPIPESLAKKYPDLKVLMDSTFVSKRRKYQESRLSEAQLKYNDTINTLEAATLFFKQIGAYSYFDQARCGWSLANLSDKDKNNLAVQYKQFQTYLAAQFPALDELIVDALQKRAENTYASQLWNTEWSQSHFTAILNSQEKVLTSIQQNAAQSSLKERLIKNTISHTKQNTHASPEFSDSLVQPLSTVVKKSSEAAILASNKRMELKPAKKEALQAQTLFGQLSDYKISQQIDQFFTYKFEVYLKKNLSQPVWLELSTPDGLSLDKNKIPFLEFHQDDPSVAMYKQLINSIYYMQKGLEKLESLNDHGDPNYIFNRSKFLMIVGDAMINITNSQYYVGQASANPALKAILEEGLEILTPLKNLAIIGDYLKPAEKQKTPQQDIVKAWKKQQAIVRSHIYSTPLSQSKSQTPLAVDTQEDTVRNDVEINYTQLLAEALYKIPAALKDQSKAPTQEEVNENIRVFVEELNSITLQKRSIMKILDAIAKLQIQISDITQSGREFTMNNLREIKLEIGTTLMKAADNTEFQLGLKPGTYSSVVNERFNQFYESLINNLPLENAQTGLEIGIDPRSIQKRLENETARFNELQADHSMRDTEKNIFSTNYVEFTQVHQPYLSMKEFAKFIEANIPEPNQALEEYIAKIDNEYKKVQLELAKIDPKFTENYIKSCNEPSSVLKAVEGIFIAKQQVNKSALDTIVDLLYLDDSFQHDENKERFLRSYEKLQPYLSQVHYRYDLVYFIRELQTPEDFRTAAEKILNDANKLHEMIKGLKHSQELKIEVCCERINYFEKLQKEHEIKAAKKIDQYKEQVFDEHLRNRLKATIGSHTDLFLEHFSNDINLEKTNILANITIHDNIEEKVTTEIDKIYSKLVNNNKKTFSVLLFDNHVKSLLNENIGSYKDLFMQQIKSDLDVLRVKIRCTEFKEKSLNEIKTQFNNEISKILQKDTRLAQVCSKLNAKNIETSAITTDIELHVTLDDSLKALDQLIQCEKILPQNQCREIKIKFLKARYDELLKIENSPATNPLKNLHYINTREEDTRRKIHDYDKLIRVYTLIEEIETYVISTKTMKQAQIDELQKIKKSIQQMSSNDPSNCLSKVQDITFFPKCEKILRNNSDILLKKLFNTLYKLFTNQNNSEKQKVAQFKERFQQIIQDSDLGSKPQQKKEEHIKPYAPILKIFRP